jgi:hypothetical protein
MRWQRLGDRICVGCLCKVESKIPLGGETKKVLTERKAKFLNLCGTTGNTDPNPNPGTLNPNRRISSNLKVILIFVCIHGACWIRCYHYIFVIVTSSCFSIFYVRRIIELNPKQGWKSFTRLSLNLTSDRPEGDQIHPKTTKTEERCHTKSCVLRCRGQDVGFRLDKCDICHICHICHTCDTCHICLRVPE